MTGLWPEEQALKALPGLIRRSSKRRVHRVIHWSDCMRILRFAGLFAIALSTTLLAQSNPASPVSRTAKVASPGAASGAGPKAQAKIFETYGKLPLSFEANHGQTDSQVKFLSRGSGYTLFLTEDEAVFSLRGGEAKGTISPAGNQLPSKAVAPTGTAVLRMKLVSADHEAAVTGLDELPGRSNYFVGSDPKKWHSNVPTFAKVKYEGIYKGIDLIYYGNQRQLEYDFVVSPGADPHRIQFDVRGASRIHLDEDGDLMLKMGVGEIRWQRPVVYQEKNGAKQKIAAHYVIKDANQVAFELAKYDTSKPLYIDPLIYSTYLGGSANDFGSAIAVDSSGTLTSRGMLPRSIFPRWIPCSLRMAAAGMPLSRRSMPEVPHWSTPVILAAAEMTKAVALPWTAWVTRTSPDSPPQPTFPR